MVDHNGTSSDEGIYSDTGMPAEDGVRRNKCVSVYNGVMIDHSPGPYDSQVPYMRPDVENSACHDHCTIANGCTIAHISLRVNERRQAVAMSQQLMVFALSRFKVLVTDGKGKVILFRPAFLDNVCQRSNNIRSGMPVIDEPTEIRTAVPYQLTHNRPKLCRPINQNFLFH